MVTASSPSPLEKVTFNISRELKEQVVALKDELHLSLSAIYNEAISEYVKRQELKRWERGIAQALKDTEYQKLSRELGADTGDVYDY